MKIVGVQAFAIKEKFHALIFVLRTVECDPRLLEFFGA
jgi:hypothetical protein